MYIPRHSRQCLSGRGLEVVMEVALPPVGAPFPRYQKQSFKDGAKVKNK